MSAQQNANVNVAVVGASPKPERYSNQAIRLLAQYGHRAIPINPAFDEIEGEKCYPSVGSVPEPINTVTMYLGKARSDPLSAEIIAKKPARIIMNPGAENDDLGAKARKHGIEVVEGCTLVMLRSETF